MGKSFIHNKPKRKTTPGRHLKTKASGNRNRGGHKGPSQTITNSNLSKLETPSGSTSCKEMIDLLNTINDVRAVEHPKVEITSPDDIQTSDTKSNICPKQTNFSSADITALCKSLKISGPASLTMHAMRSTGVPSKNYVEPIIENFVKNTIKELNDTNKFSQFQEEHIINNYLTPNQVEYMKMKSPELQLISSIQNNHTSTPIYNDELQRCESISINFIRDRFPNAQIVDIGGNAKQHSNRNHDFIWTCNPILTPSDACDQVINQYLANQCSHTAQHCTCITPDAYISIISLQHLTPEDIVGLVMFSKRKLLLAVHLNYDSAFGSFCNGEVKYMLDDCDHVSVTLKNKTKRMNNLRWMKPHVQHFVINDKPVSLVWTEIYTFRDHTVTMFTVHQDHIPTHIHTTHNLQSTLKSDTYYGCVTMANPTLDNTTINVDGEQLSFEDVSIHSWGPFILMFNNQTQQTYMAPKGLITDIEMYAMGKDRNSDTLKNCVAHARVLAKKYNIPGAIMAASVFASACLGFVQHLSHETSVLHSVIKPMVTLSSIHSNALKYNFKTVWKWKRLVKLALAALGVATAAATIHSLIPIISAIGVATTITATGLLVGSSVAISTHTHGDALFDDFKVTRCSPPPIYRNYAVHTQYLPSTPPTIPLELLLTTQLDPTAKLTIHDSETIKHIDTPLCVAGLVTTHSIPIVPERSAHSSISSQVGRQLKVQPVSTEMFSPEFFEKFHKYVMQHMHEFFPNAHLIGQIDFEAWNVRFPASQQSIHLAARNDVLFGKNDVDKNLRSTFVKSEHYPKTDTLGVTSMTPRCIQSAKPEHNVITGPYMYQFSDYLKQIWSVDNPVGLVYASSITADRIGKYFQNSIDPSAVVYEGDYNRYDASMHCGLLRTEIEVYRHCGAPNAVLQALERSLHTEFYDKYGNHAVVLGTRHSGDPNTSCGNTLISGLISTFCAAAQHDYISPIKLWNKISMRGLFLGDDSLISMKTVDPTQYTLDLRKLGTDLEPQVHHGLDAMYKPTFCSSRFYPVLGLDGQLYVVLGPPIGRVLTKAGYYVDIPTHLSPASIVRGDALGRIHDCHFIPFLSDYWQHVSNLTKDVVAAPDTKQDKVNRYCYHVEHKYLACDATWAMLEHVYGLTRDDWLKFKCELSAVTSLPHVLDLPIFSKAFIVDGMYGDREEHFNPEVNHSSIEIEPISTEPLERKAQIMRCAIPCPQVTRLPTIVEIVDDDQIIYQ